MHDDAGEEATALHLTLRREIGAERPEIWTAHLEPASAPGDGAILAEATLHRVHYADPKWPLLLRGVHPDLGAVASAFVDRELVSLLDESSLFTDGLCIISRVRAGADEEPGDVGHALVREIARVFDADSIALLTARAVVAEGGPGDGASALTRERARWARLGFIDIPGTAAMLLPMSSRP